MKQIINGINQYIFIDSRQSEGIKPVDTCKECCRRAIVDNSLQRLIKRDVGTVTTEGRASSTFGRLEAERGQYEERDRCLGRSQPAGSTTCHLEVARKIRDSDPPVATRPRLAQEIRKGERVTDGQKDNERVTGGL